MTVIGIMRRYYEKIADLDRDIDVLMRNKPHVKPLLEAFAPIFRLKNLVLESGLFEALSGGHLPGPLTDGAPLILSHPPLIEQEMLNEAARMVLDAIAQGFPKLGKDLEILASQLIGQEFSAGAIFPSSHVFIAVPDGAVPSGMISANQAAMNLFINVLRKIILSKWENAIAGNIDATGWTKGYCPVCGSLPSLSISQGKGRPWLHCAACGHEWRFPWAKCPSCGNERPEEALYFFVDGEKDEKVFTCRNCRRYLLSFRRYEDHFHGDPELAAIGMTHLDIIMQQKGLTPTGFCEWNYFATRDVVAY